MKKLLGLFLLVICLSITKSASAQATQFPSCQNYSGTIQAQYESGSHAIVGDPNNEDGADTVYDLGNGNFMQCFCPAIGDNGIQTNWLSANSLSEQDQQNLQSQGWVRVDNGDGWGLEPNPYLAQNSNFSCGGNPGNTGGTGGPSGGSPSVCTDSVPQTPYIVSAGQTNNNSVSLKWQTNPGTNNYSIFYGTSSKNYQYSVPATGNVTSFNIGNLNQNSTYCFTIKALNGCNVSDNSNEVCTTLTSTSTSNGQRGEILGASSLAPTGSEIGQMQVFGGSILSLLSLSYGVILKKNSKV